MILESRSESTSQRGLIGMTAVLNALVARGYLGDAEYFGVYSPDTGKVYLILVSEVPGTWDVKLRIKKSKNNQEKGVRWAYKYEL